MRRVISGHLSDAVDLPIPIEDAETIVRAVVAPAHYKNGKLATAVFRPPAGKSSISVMRQRMGDNYCKKKGVEIGSASPGQQYVGLLTIRAGAIRNAGSFVSDSRDEWLGHADLDHGFVSVPNDPLRADEFARMTERCQALKKSSTFYADPDTASVAWSGPPLRLE